jgi:uncharacterized protein (TIGR02271 family)
MYERTVTALYDSRDDAEAARERLADAGISPDRISLHARDGTTEAEDDRDEGFWASLRQLFMPEDDRHTYAEGLRRGGTLLAARVPADYIDDAVRALEDTEAVDIEARSADWRGAGWSGVAAASSPAFPVAAGAATTDGGRRADGGREEAIPVAEEQLRVGKREVERGSVRVRSYVVETPVEEQVSLRDETVRVERRPANDDAGRDATAAFQERTIEMTETAEEAVVDKRARVTEEVVVRKDVTEQTETVRDKVRHTEVEVDDTRGAGRRAAGQDRRLSGD